jgi:hypothetical protein
MDDQTREELAELLELLKGDRQEPTPSLADTLWPDSDDDNPPDMRFNLPGPGMFQ